MAQAAEAGSDESRKRVGPQGLLLFVQKLEFMQALCQIAQSQAGEDEERDPQGETATFIPPST
jgi:hypothetical protein